MSMSVPMIAGTVSTALFVGSYLPMLYKAFRTKDLTSYSLGNLAIANIGNVVHSVYVYSLPLGPIWFLHTFYVVATAAMLTWYWMYARRPVVGSQRSMKRAADEDVLATMRGRPRAEKPAQRSLRERGLAAMARCAA